MYELRPEPGYRPDTIQSWIVVGAAAHPASRGYVRHFWTADYPTPDACFRTAKLFCDAKNIVEGIENPCTTS